MYDGTKKNWSQRLKIHNRTKSNASYPTITSVTNTNLNLHQTTIKDTPSIVHNGNISNATKQQQKPQTVFRGHPNTSVPSQYKTQKTAVMLLPDDFPLTYDYNAVVNSVAGGSTRGTMRKYEKLTQAYSFAPKIKYDEPWIYSTVRGVPGQPLSFYHNIQNHVLLTPSYSHHPLSTAILATPSLSIPTSSNKSAVAVVICSCPGYLFGTKRRELKKALICKKCKGTQLPLSSIGRPIPLHDHIGSRTIPLNNNKLRLSESSATVQYISPMKKMRPTILEPQKDPYSLMRRTRLLSPEPVNGTFPMNNKFPNKAKFGSYTNTSTPIRERTRSRIPKPSIDHSKMNLSNKIDDNWLSEIESGSDVGSIGRRSILSCSVNPYDLISFDNQSIVTSDDDFPQKLTNNNIRSTADSKGSPRKNSHSNLFKKNIAPTNKELRAGNNIQIEQFLPLHSQSTKSPDLAKIAIESEEEKSSDKSDNTSETDPQSIPKSNKNYPKDNTVKAESLLLKCEFNNKSSYSEESSYNSPTTGIGEPCIKLTPTATHNIKSILKRPSLKSGGGEIEITASIPQIYKDAIVNESQNNNNLIILTSAFRNHEESNAPTANFLSTVGLPYTRKKVQFMVVDTQQIHQSEEKDNNPQLEQEHQNNINADDVCTAFDGVLIQAMLLEKLQLDAKVGNQNGTTDKHAITATEETPPQNETGEGDLKEPLNNANETNNKKLQLPNQTNEKEETKSEINRKHRNISETQISMNTEADNKVENRNSNTNVDNKSTNNIKNENNKSVTAVNKTILKITNNGFHEDGSAEVDRKLTGSAFTESLLSSQSTQKAKHHSIFKNSQNEGPHNDEAIGIKRNSENSYHTQDLYILGKSCENNNEDEVSEESTWHTNNSNKNTNLNNEKTRNVATKIKEIKRNDEVDDVKCEAAPEDNQTLSPKVTATTLGNISSKISQTCDKPQRTVVRVAPFNKNTKEIHRLKIAHTDEKIKHVPLSLTIPGPHNLYTSSTDFGQKKTSILINGDDCYSTIQLGCDDTCTPLYQSSVVVNDNNSNKILQDPTVGHSVNAITINVRNPHNINSNQVKQQNKDSAFLNQQQQSRKKLNKSIIPISDPNFSRSASSSSATSLDSSSASNSSHLTPKHNRTLIHLTYKGDELKTPETCQLADSNSSTPNCGTKLWLPHEEELLKILRNPVEAVKLNLVPHICGLQNYHNSGSNHVPSLVDTNKQVRENQLKGQPTSHFAPKTKWCENESFITKLLKDPMLSQVADGLETDTIVDLIENSLRRLQDTRDSLDMSETKDIADVNRLISISLKLIQEEKVAGIYNINRSTEIHDQQQISPILSNNNTRDEESLSNRGSISSINSFTSAHNYEISDLENNESDCYHSCSSEIASFMDDDSNGHNEARSKFYKMLVDATLAEIESTTHLKEEDDLDINNHNNEHEYESICLSGDPIYEEISDVPPPLPLSSPPLNDEEMHIKATRSIFEGASKYDILSYLVDARERGLVKEEKCDSFNSAMPIIIQEESLNAENNLNNYVQKKMDTKNLRSANYDRRNALTFPVNCNQNVIVLNKKQIPSDIERNDSGVGSESSKSSRSKYQSKPKFNSTFAKELCSSPLHLCEDCDGPVETQVTGDGILFTSFVCRKCGKKRMERKEIITEIVETEEKYGRDLQIILEEFCQPMLVAGLLTQEQLSAIFLNTEELLENSQTLAERMRDALDIALEQGDDDLLTVNIGKLFLESTQMLHAFESYCVRQAGASLLLANLEKEKELLRIFLKVSQMENTVLRRMNLNSFLMVPVQRVTKYPLLLARLYKVTPAHLDICGQLKQAQEKIELHLNHINQEAKDVPTKLWRRISSSSPNRRRSYEIDMINIKLRKMAIEILEWNHEEVRFAMEGKLLYTQPTDSNWKKARTIKFIKVIALLVTNGKPTINCKGDRMMPEKLNFPKQNGIRDASLLLIKEKSGRYTLIHEPLYLDKCLVCSDADWDEYFEIQDISSKDAFIFKAEDNVRTKQWYTTLQCHAQGMGSWRKRRNALANIMINGMLTRS